MSRGDRPCRRRETSLFGVTLALILVAGCTVEEDLGDAELLVAVNCMGPDCGELAGPVRQGDTAWVLTSFRDPTPDEEHLPRTRAICDVNVEVRQAGMLVATIPAEPWCPDSTLLGGDNWPGSVLTAHLYQWPVPENFPAGKYQLTTVLLEHPAVTRTITIEIK